MNTSYTKTAWIEHNGPISKFLGFIAGDNLGSVTYCEARLLNSISENGDCSINGLDSASDRLLLPTKLFFGEYIRFSLYTCALYPILIGYFAYSKNSVLSIFLFIIGIYYLTWYYKGFHPIVKSHIKAVKTAKDNIWLTINKKLLTDFLAPIMLEINNKIAYLENENNKETPSKKKRENYHLPKKVLLLYFIKFLSKDNSGIDLGKNISPEHIKKLSEEAKSTIDTIKINLPYFKNIDSFMEQTSGQLKYFIKPLTELMDADSYTENIKFRSTVDSLLDKIRYKIKHPKK